MGAADRYILAAQLVGRYGITEGRALDDADGIIATIRVETGGDLAEPTSVMLNTSQQIRLEVLRAYLDNSAADTDGTVATVLRLARAVETGTDPGDATTEDGA